MKRPSAARLLRRGSTAMVIALLAGGCASAEKRMNQGMTLEQRGRPADASARYIDALEKDPSLATARARLRDSGGRAVHDALAEATALDAAGRSPEAADALLRLDALLRDARRVGVQLAAPADYAQRRRYTFDRAIAASAERARRAGADGEFGDAVAGLERAERRWEPNAEQLADLNRARYDVQVGWAEAGMRAGHFRAAYERARTAATLADREGGAADRASAIQEEALRRGTVRVAILPVGTEGAAAGKLPADVVPALNDELDANHWSRSPLFVQVLDPRALRVAARRHGYARSAPSLRDAVQLGRAVGAHLVLRAAIDSVSTAESEVRETRRPARTRAGADTAYTVREGRRALRVRVTYTVVHVDGYRESSREEVWGSGDGPFREGRYDGDLRALALSGRERDLFDARASRATDELTRELAARMERQVFDRLLREVR